MNNIPRSGEKLTGAILSWLVFPVAFPKAGKINSVFKLTTQGKAISQAARRNFALGSTNYRPLRSIKGNYLKQLYLAIKVGPLKQRAKLDQ